MSTTQMTTSNNLAVKLWERKTWYQMMQKACLGHLFNRGCIYYPEELKTGNQRNARGDAVTFAYVSKLTNVPVGEGGTLDGNEEALDLNSHQMVMGVTRYAVSNPNSDTIEQQRTKVNFSESSIKQIAQRGVELMDTSVWTQLAGVNYSGPVTYNGTTYVNADDKLHITGNNVPTDPTSERIIRAGAQANDQSLTATDIMSIDLIDFALEKIEESDQPIERLDGETYDLYVSPQQLVDLQQNSSAAIKWYEIQFSKLAGDQDDATIEKSFKNNMICAGRYRNVFIYMAPRIPNGLSSVDNTVVATAKRAVLVGRDALSFASPFGGRATDEDVPMRMYSQLKDFDYFKADEGRLIYGLKKMSPSNKQDVGVIVISTYAASHS